MTPLLIAAVVLFSVGSAGLLGYYVAFAAGHCGAGSRAEELAEQREELESELRKKQQAVQPMASKKFNQKVNGQYVQV